MNSSMLFLATILPNATLLKKAFELEARGIVAQEGAYTYLKINDAYIHELYELLGSEITAQKPDYFLQKKRSLVEIREIFF